MKILITFGGGTLKSHLTLHKRSMKTMKPKNGETIKKSWILPGTGLTRDEFIHGIREAEKGPFSTVQESLEHFEKWLDQRKKK